MPPMNNSSFFTADRATHLKIVVVSLLASIVVLAIGIAARPQLPNSTLQATVYKPPKAILATTDTAPAVR
jgi:ABC-type proline/glycine betaine transport system permease subunit